MRSGLITFRAAGVVAVLVLAPAAPAAYAADSVTVTVVPSKVAPGGEVEVLVSGCQGMTGAARSQGFVTLAALASRNGAGTQLFGGTTVKTSMKPGTYDVGITCDGREYLGSARVQVVHNQLTEQPDEPTKQPDEPAKRRDRSTERPDEPTEKSDESSEKSDEPTEKSDESTDHSTPFAPVRAGGGGSADLAADGPADPAEAGPGIPHAVIGLVLAGVAAVAVAFRSSRRRRSDSD